LVKCPFLYIPTAQKDRFYSPIVHPAKLPKKIAGQTPVLRRSEKFQKLNQCRAERQALAKKRRPPARPPGNDNRCDDIRRDAADHSNQTGDEPFFQTELERSEPEL
jgi:hypothetical protein